MDGKRKLESPGQLKTDGRKRLKPYGRQEINEHSSGVNVEKESLDAIKEQRKLIYKTTFREYRESLQRNRADAEKDKRTRGGSPLRDYLLEKIQMAKDEDAEAQMQHNMMALKHPGLGHAFYKYLKSTKEQGINHKVQEAEWDFRFATYDEINLPVMERQKLNEESKPIQQELTYLNKIRQKMSIEGTEKVADDLSSRQQDLRQQVEQKQRQSKDNGLSELTAEIGQMQRELTYLDRISPDRSKEKQEDFAKTISSRQQNLDQQMRQKRQELTTKAREQRMLEFSALNNLFIH